MKTKDFGDLKLAIVTSGQAAPVETFIQAHLNYLPFEITHLSGYEYQYQYCGRTIRNSEEMDWRSLVAKASSLLPNYLGFRLRRRFENQKTDLQVLGQFLIEMRIDVVLTEYGMMGAFLAPVCKETGIPLVVHFHGADASQRSYLENFADSYRRMFSTAAACIAVSEKMRNDLIQLGCPAGKIVVSACGPNDLFFDCVPNYHSNQMIAVGRLTNKKAPHLTILAFSELLKSHPNLSLVIIGDGELRGVCEDLVKSLDLAGKVCLRGSQSPEEIRCEMKRSFLFMQHSVEAWDGDCEGTPVSVLEAGAAGLPVVATRHAGIMDVVVHERTGMLCEERDVKTMVSYLRELAFDRDKARTLGVAASNHIRRNFSMQAHLASLSHAISGCAAKARIDDEA